MTVRTGPASTLPRELLDLLDGGCTIYAATRTASLAPDHVMAYALRLESAAELSLFVAEATASRTLENLRDNGQIAVSVTRPSSDRSVQLKGELVRVVPATDEDRQFIERYRVHFLDEMERVGVPRAFTARLPWWPTVALRIGLRDIFLQTPGPDAGRRLGEGA